MLLAQQKGEMGTYNLSAKELAEIINDALNSAEGDFGYDELKDAWELVVATQQNVQQAPGKRRNSARSRDRKSKFGSPAKSR
jgi:hypothetical protein